MRCEPSKIALAIFSYNRPQHLNIMYQTITTLNLEERYCFHLFNDGPKKTKTPEITLVQELTDKFSHQIPNFVLTRKSENFGLAKSIRSGLNSVFEEHERTIILEDDIIPMRTFFETMEFYLRNEAHNLSIGSITGANTTKFPVLCETDFLASKRHSSWGWATWSDRWLSIDWKYVEEDFLHDKQVIKKVKGVSPDLVRYAKLQESGKIDSWATGMNIDFIKRDLLCIVPRRNLIINLGFDGSGTHGGKLRRRIDLEILRTSEPKLKLVPVAEQSLFYNFLVKKDNSLMRDFPRGNILRFLGNCKSAILRLSSKLILFRQL